jgi:hypothetical protein
MLLLRSFRLLVREYTSFCRHYANIFILIPAKPPSKKRKLDYDASGFKDINTPPLSFSKPSTFRRLNEAGGRAREVYIHNGPIDFESVPLTLISPIFGRLSDDLFTNHEVWHFSSIPVDCITSSPVAWGSMYIVDNNKGRFTTRIPRPPNPWPVAPSILLRRPTHHLCV